MPTGWTAPYMGNNNPSGDHEFHEISNEKSQCQLQAIITADHAVVFWSKQDALNAGYDPCNWCMPGQSTR